MDGEAVEVLGCAGLIHAVEVGEVVEAPGGAVGFDGWGEGAGQDLDVGVGGFDGGVDCFEEVYVVGGGGLAVAPFVAEVGFVADDEVVDAAVLVVVVAGGEGGGVGGEVVVGGFVEVG